MSTWLARLKTHNTPGTGATKPTKPTQDTPEGGFVGFVAHPQGHIQKIDGAVANPETPAANAPAPAPTPSGPTWRELDRAYLAHHQQCSACQCAGRRRGDRCAVGAALWRAYEAAPVPWQIPASVKRQETTQKDQNLDALHWAAMRACDFWGDSEAQQQAMREWCDLVPPAERTAWINYCRTIYPMEGQPWSSN